uniref:CASP-like protein n=1 Tax=Triticum urartu TaxID=4572 RepID=A0A8R7R7N9_TRIUA
MATTSLLLLAFSTMLSAHFMSDSCSSPPATRSFQQLHAVAFFSSTALASMAAAVALALSSSLRCLTAAARFSWSTTALAFSPLATSGFGAGISGMAGAAAWGALGFTSCSLFTVGASFCRST